MVRKAGLEPACLSAPPPQDGVSANSTTSALPSFGTEVHTRAATNHKLPKNVYRGNLSITNSVQMGSLGSPGIEHNCGIPSHPQPERRQLTRIRLRSCAGSMLYHFTIFENESGLRLAPPTSAPSISSCESNWWAFSGLTLPP